MKSVFAAETCADLGPVLSVRFCYIPFSRRNKVGGNKHGINFPAGTSSGGSSGWRLRGGPWRRICRGVSSLPGFFHLRSICSFCCQTFPVSGRGLWSWMRGTNMSVVRCEVVESFATYTTSESAFGSSLVVRFQMLIQIWFRLKPFVAAGTFVWFLPSVDALMGLQIIYTREGLPTGLAAMLFTNLFRWGFTIPELNFL